MGDIGDIYINVFYLYRYNNLPASITLTEDQKLQFEDIKFLVFPYHCIEQETSYRFVRFLYILFNLGNLTKMVQEKDYQRFNFQRIVSNLLPK